MNKRDIKVLLESYYLKSLCSYNDDFYPIRVVEAVKSIIGINLDKNTPKTLKKIAAGGSRTIITAGKKGEIAQERPEWGGSPFVKNIVSGLEKGMADDNGDGFITECAIRNIFFIKGNICFIINFRR